MPAATTTKARRAPARRRPAPDPLLCQLCPTEHPTETDLVVHLVDEHAAIWTTTNSFGLQDLMIPAPRESYEDEPEPEVGWFSRLIRRTA